jgi:hypothetical protein
MQSTPLGIIQTTNPSIHPSIQKQKPPLITYILHIGISLLVWNLTGAHALFERFWSSRRPSLIVTLESTHVRLPRYSTKVFLVEFVQGDSSFGFELGVQSLCFCLCCGACHLTMLYVREGVEWSVLSITMELFNGISMM